MSEKKKNTGRRAANPINKLGIEDLYILRTNEVVKATGIGKTNFYDKINLGLWPKGIPLGARAVGWPVWEVRRMLEAIASGMNEEGLHEVVLQIERYRKLGESTV